MPRKSKKEEPVLDTSKMLEIRQESSKLSKHMLEKLRLLQITIPWKLAPLHAEDNCISKDPSKQFRQEMETKYVVKKGQFSPAEDAIIKKNFKCFCETYDLKEDPKLFMKFKVGDKKGVNFSMSKSNRLNFVRYLARDLPDRYLSAVYHRFQRMHFKEKGKEGKFSEKEDKIIKAHLQTNYNKPFEEISQILNRDRKAVYRRCKKLLRMTDSNQVTWNVEKIEEYLNNLRDFTSVDDIEDFKKRGISSKEFKTLSEKMDLPVKKLKEAWFFTIYPRLFIKGFSKRMSKKVKIKLINLLYEGGYKYRQSVDYNKIAKEFPEFLPCQLSRYVRMMIHTHVPKDLQGNFRSCVKYLYKNFEKKSIKVADKSLNISVTCENEKVHVIS